MHVQYSGKIVEIWLTQADQASLDIQLQLAQLYQDCRNNGQLAVVYRSGNKDLSQETSALLSHNRKRSAQIVIQTQNHVR